MNIMVRNYLEVVEFYFRNKERIDSMAKFSTSDLTTATNCPEVAESLVNYLEQYAFEKSPKVIFWAMGCVDTLKGCGMS